MKEEEMKEEIKKDIGGELAEEKKANETEAMSDEAAGKVELGKDNAAQAADDDSEGIDMINTEKVYRSYDDPKDRKITVDEMIAKIVARTGITKEQACEALEKNNNDLLDAMIYVERTYGQASKTQAQQSTYANTQQSSYQNSYQSAYQSPQGSPVYSTPPMGEQKDYAEAFKKNAGKVGKTLIANSLVIYKDGQEVTSLPLIAAIIALLISFNAVAVIAIGAMFFGVSYRFRGPDFTSPKANTVLDTIYGMAKTLKTTLSGVK